MNRYKNKIKKQCKKENKKLPSGETIEVSPEVVNETREIGVYVVRLTETADNLIENLHFHPLSTVYGCLRRRQDIADHSTPATLLVVVLHLHH